MKKMETFLFKMFEKRTKTLDKLQIQDGKELNYEWLDVVIIFYDCVINCAFGSYHKDRLASINAYSKQQNK